MCRRDIQAHVASNKKSLQNVLWSVEWLLKMQSFLEAILHTMTVCYVLSAFAFICLFLYSHSLLMALLIAGIDPVERVELEQKNL